MKSWILSVLLLVVTVPVTADHAQTNKDRAIRMHELINERDFDALDEIIAEDVMRHSAATIGMTVTNLAQFKEFLRADLTAVPDAHVEIDQIIAVGQMVALRAIYRGTQTGPMGPYPPSGKSFELPYIGMLRFDGAKIVEMWVEWDNLSALMELGHISPPEPLPATGKMPLTDEEKKALARRWFDEVINDRNVEAIADIYADAYQYHGSKGMEFEGLKPMREFAAAILAASDDRHAVVDQQIVKGDLVVTRFTSRGTHTGTWQGISPSGNTWTTEGIVISRIENGQIVEDWEVITNSGL